MLLYGAVVSIEAPIALLRRGIAPADGKHLHAIGDQVADNAKGRLF